MRRCLGITKKVKVLEDNAIEVKCLEFFLSAQMGHSVVFQEHSIYLFSVKDEKADRL